MKRTQIMFLAVVVLSALATATVRCQQAVRSYEVAGRKLGREDHSGPVHVSYKVTAGGSAIMSEIRSGMQAHSMVQTFNLERKS